MSGGGIWRLFDRGAGINALDWKRAKLVGILTAGTEEEYTGPVPYLLGTKLWHVIKLFLAGWPELAPILAKSVPPKFVNDPA